MASKTAFQARFREAVREFLAAEELPESAAGEALFTVIEELALDAGDAVSLEVFDRSPRGAASTCRSRNKRATAPVVAGLFSLAPRRWGWTSIITTGSDLSQEMCVVRQCELHDRLARTTRELFRRARSFASVHGAQQVRGGVVRHRTACA